MEIIVINESIVRKGENAGTQHLLLFPTMFSTRSKTEIVNLAILNMLSAFSLVKTKFLLFGKQLSVTVQTFNYHIITLVSDAI